MSVPGRVPLFSSPRIAALVKSLVALCVFFATIAAWNAVQAAWRRYTPLPDDRVSGACALWVVGSSTVARWQTLPADLAPWEAHRRGVGGALIPELVERLKRDESARAPAAILIYAGDNDLADGRDAARVAGDLAGLIAVRDARWPDTPAFVVTIKPSPGRWELRGEQRRFDAIAGALAERRRALTLLDAGRGLLANGAPHPPYYQPDGVHLSDSGYRIWAREVRAALDRALPAGLKARCDRG